MTATYTNQPGVRDVDTVRFLVADRDTVPETDAKLSDEEIQFLIDSNAHIRLAAADAASAIGATYAAGETSKSVGDLSRDFGNGRLQTYGERAQQLRREAYRDAVPFAGGLSKDGKITGRQDTDRVDTFFARGDMDHVGDRDGDDFYDDVT